MKNSLACPKCESRKLWQINGVRAHSDTDLLPLPVAVVTETTGSFIKVHNVQTIGHYDAYICAKCGYTEFFADDIEGLKHHPECGIRLLDSTPQQSEYR